MKKFIIRKKTMMMMNKLFSQNIRKKFARVLEINVIDYSVETTHVTSAPYNGRFCAYSFFSSSLNFDSISRSYEISKRKRAEQKKKKTQNE